MSNERVWKSSAWWLGAAIALVLSGACRKETVDRNVEDLKDTSRDVAATVHEAADQAKQGAEKVKTQLPAATERAKDELNAAGEKVKETLHAAGDKMREGADEARDTVKGKE
ncbi:MAG TPA: hypothetical protein VFG30_10100 [Polyangiales bacterium]|jgi:hypothetical protein|nr:hypothetical protein [Polyangiales bacterium]